jgi:hypothetical protein
MTNKTRKELMEEYKQRKFRMGIYQIRNTVNGKVLLGSNTDLDAAWNSQKFQLELGSHRNPLLQKEWKEFGAEAFVYEILEETSETADKIPELSSQLKEMEALLIEETQPYEEKGYHKTKAQKN